MKQGTKVINKLIIQTMIGVGVVCCIRSECQLQRLLEIAFAIFLRLNDSFFILI